MNERGAKLKRPSGWFAAGREVERAIGLLSDGAFKLYIHICLRADRRTGQLRADQRGLVNAVGKSRRSVVTYLEELRQLCVCTVQSAVNQHLGGQIEICDAFWPYEKASSTARADAVTDYIEQIRRLLKSRHCVANSFTPVDEQLAIALFERGVPIEQIDHGILLGCARKYVALLNGNHAGLIASFHYFQNVIDEAGEQNMPPHYWRYLQLQVDRLEQQWSQKRLPLERNR